MWLRMIRVPKGLHPTARLQNAPPTVFPEFAHMLQIVSQLEGLDQQARSYFVVLLKIPITLAVRSKYMLMAAEAGHIK